MAGRGTAGKTGHGGAREGAGRPPGSVSKEALALRRSAKEQSAKYIEDAWATVGELCKNAKAESVRLSAATLIIERHHGKVPTELLDEDGQPTSTAISLEEAGRMIAFAMRAAAEADKKRKRGKQ